MSETPVIESPDTGEVAPVSRRQIAVLVVLIPVLLAGTWLLGRVLYGSEPTGDRIDISTVSDAGPFEHDFVIPNGTRGRIEAGEAVDVVPAQLTVYVGDAIRIVNDDVAGHQVGVFYVGAGETLTQRFNGPGTLTDKCDVHSSGAFTLTVLPAP